MNDSGPEKAFRLPTMWASKYRIMMIPLTAITVFFTTELSNRPVLGALRWAGCVVTVATGPKVSPVPT
ncbi:hypothetical protein GCM10023328_22070 [Modestobacter marinus]|uniref:Uncharacterized protein n=1 Tax=Modestobacter marinus TaxID=477641 RepID=A0ABQ2FYZ1_9ACTN|nr:hypothetical protein GCM10011589_24280 [Modestobacter marinus]